MGELIIFGIIWIILLSIMKDSKASVWRVIFFFVSIYLLYLIFIEILVRQLFNAFN
jgi:hypothetical protein